MHTECTLKKLKYQGLFNREIVSDFCGGQITSDGGGLLLREINLGRGIINGFSKCFKDYRNRNQIDHSVEDLVGQRVYGLALGYEDLNDHDDLRVDPLLAVLVGKASPDGGDRRLSKDKGKALAGKSTLNRLELTPQIATEQSRYKKIVYDSERIDKFFVNLFLNSYKGSKNPSWIVLDIDATDDPTHGKQEGNFFHGYYGHYCYLPLYVFCGDHLLCSRLRTSNIDPAKGAVEELSRIVSVIGKRWPGVNIIIRGDSGFCRDSLMSWCESQKQVYYLLGLAKNNRLKKKLGKALSKAKRRYFKTGKPARFFRCFRYRTLNSWSRKRRVIGKAEYLAKGENPRFIVTNLPTGFASVTQLYEEHYCARGDMENRIKEQQLGLFADRTSTELIRSNQLRLYFSSLAYILMAELRRVGLKGTQMANAQVGTIRTKLFKIGALVKISVRRVYLAFGSGYPYSELFERVLDNIKRAYPLLN
ncbi:MAG: IS1380 family transposase [Pseudomonadales bacterium]|nr:IS1380 family transposase [Pseudomonadales bacterium]